MTHHAQAFALTLMAGSLAAAGDPEHRSFDGSGNNEAHPTWGSVDTHLMRMAPVSYADQISMPARMTMPSAREISNAVCAQSELMPNSLGASNFLWQWGQFVDHDLDLTDVMVPLEPLDIEIPPGDPVFDPMGKGGVTIPFNRSIYDTGTGTGVKNPRQQINQITAFQDASNVYGSDAERAAALRTNDGTGQLKTSDGNLLPFNLDGLPNLGGPSPTLFVAGDIRANEQVGLTSMHTLFMREHNHQAQEIAAAQPELTGDQIYQAARARVGAIMQVITYREFLPLLLGPDALDPYQGYRPDVNPSIANLFSAAAYRVGHTLLSPTLLRLEADSQPIAEGHLALADAFFTPWRLIEEGGIEPVLRGLAAAPAQEVDVKVIDDVRNFLFLAPDPTFLDLPALNMQRGRDHGIPSYRQARLELGMDDVASFEDISSDPEVQSALASIYSTVDEIDPWLGALAEDHHEHAMVGELMFHVIKDQFERLRDGDRFWYELIFSGEELAELEGTRLSDVIRRNTTIDVEIQNDVFRLPELPCPTDLDRSGAVDVDDLVSVLLQWGVAGGPADIDRSGVVDVDDLILVLLTWGPCS